MVEDVDVFDELVLNRYKTLAITHKRMSVLILMNNYNNDNHEDTNDDADDDISHCSLW